MSKTFNFRLNAETAKLYEEYLEKWNIDGISDSQIIRAGLAFLMTMPEAVNEKNIDDLLKKQEQIQAKIRKIIQNHPDPKFYELWKQLMENTEKIYQSMAKSSEKYSNVMGDGKAGRKPDPNKKHSPGRIPESEKGYNF